MKEDKNKKSNSSLDKAIQEIIKSDLIQNQKILWLEAIKDRLIKEGKDKNQKEINLINESINKLREDQRKEMERMEIEVPIDDLRLFYPKYFKKYKKRFNEFFRKWRNSIEDDRNIKSVRLKLFSYGAKQVVERVIDNQKLSENIHRFEQDDEKGEEDLIGSILEMITEEPIEDVFVIPELVIDSLINSKSEWKESMEEFEKELKRRNRTEEIINNKIKKLLRDKRKLTDNAKKFTSIELMRIVDNHRKKNGKINYSRTAKKMGRSHHTIKRWCEEYGIN